MALSMVIGNCESHNFCFCSLAKCRVKRLRWMVVPALLFSLAGCASTEAPTVLSEKYDYDSLIRATQAAFKDRNADVAVEAFEDAGVFYRVTEDGAVELIRGKDNLRRSMRMIFAADNGYVDSRVVRLGLIQNILVMYHEDRYETDDGIKMIPRVVVVEHRNGKRWREWEFSPKDW